MEPRSLAASPPIFCVVLAAITGSFKNISEILVSAVEIALDRKDPKRKHQRRFKRETSRASPSQPRPGEVASGDDIKSRYIVAAAPSADDRSLYESSFKGAPPPAPPPLIQPAQPDVYNFRFRADGAFKAKLDRLAEVLFLKELVIAASTTHLTAGDAANERDSKSTTESPSPRVETTTRRTSACSVGNTIC